MSASSSLLTIALTIMAVVQVLPAAEKPSANLIGNSDFESEGGWRSNWEPWPGVKARMKMLDDPQAAFNGRRSLEVECTQNSSGLTQWASNSFPIEKNQAYRIRFQYRGKAVAKLTCNLRQVTPPWTGHGSLVVSPVLEWNRGEYMAIASASIDNAALFFAFEGVGTVWLDDVSITPIDLPKVKPQPTGNLLPNASFELPLNYMDWGSELSDQYTFDTNASPDGRRSLRMLAASAPLKWGQVAGNLLRSPSLPLRQFCDHTLAATLRADKPTKVTLAMRSGKLTMFEQAFTVGPEWQRVSATGNTKLGDSFHVEILSDGPFEIDAIYLGEGTTAPRTFTTRSPVESCVRVVPNPSKMFVPGNAIALQIAASGDVRKRPYRLSLEAFDGKQIPIASGQIEGGAEPTTVTFRPERFGPFRVVLDVDGAAPAIDAFAVVPPRDAPPSPDSPFGGHVGGTDPVMLDMVQKMGVGWHRALWPPGITQWRSVEPKKGEWAFKDEQMAAFTRAHVNVMGSLMSTPDWAAVGQKQSAPGSVYSMAYPNDINDWRNYVTAVAKAYPQITTWELFNEPNVGIFWQGTHEQLMEMAAVAIDAIRKVNPDAKFVTQDFPGLTALKDAGVLQHVSALSEHWYAHGSTVDARVDQINGWIKSLRQGLADNGQPQVELWNTEFGPGAWGAIRSNDLTNRRRAVEYIVKHLSSQRAQGVAKFFPYHLRQAIGADGNNTFERDLTPTTGIAAYAVMIHLLENAKPAGELALSDPSLRAYQFESGQDLLVFAWSRDPEKTKTLGKPPAGVRVLDMFANPIADDDVTLEQMPKVFIGPKDQVVHLLTTPANP